MNNFIGSGLEKCSDISRSKGHLMNANTHTDLTLAGWSSIFSNFQRLEALLESVDNCTCMHGVII